MSECVECRVLCDVIDMRGERIKRLVAALTCIVELWSEEEHRLSMSSAFDLAMTEAGSLARELARPAGEDGGDGG